MKIASNAVFKNRADGVEDPGVPMNDNSIAYWVTAQPGTDSGALLSEHDCRLLLQRPQRDAAEP